MDQLLQLAQLGEGELQEDLQPLLKMVKIFTQIYSYFGCEACSETWWV